MTHKALPQLYPLLFEPIYKAKVWGGRRFATLGRDLPGDENHLIGESWELVDLDQTSLSGGGGGQERSRVVNGPLAGCTLAHVMDCYGEHLMGRLRRTESGEFPLLVKFLDAHDNLSVQVHPSRSYSDTHPEAHLKSEAWYIVDAVEGAVIYKGVKPTVTAEQFREGIENGTVEGMMIAVPVKAGDCHYLPSGTCHALGAGILVAEVQTPSDTTFRVYDWGRSGRELHVEQAMACIQFGPYTAEMIQGEKRSHIAGMFTTITRLVTCDHFRIEKVRMSQGYQQEIPYDQPAVWIVLEGAGRITPAPGSAPGSRPGGDPGSDPNHVPGSWSKDRGLKTQNSRSLSLPWPVVEFRRGQTMLVPAGINDAHVQLDEDTVWLEVTFPQAMAELIA